MEITEKEKQEIQEQAKKILNNFAKALERVKVSEARVEREKDRRTEKEGKITDSDFRNRMLQNAPKTKDECIEAEKGAWL